MFDKKFTVPALVILVVIIIVGLVLAFKKESFSLLEKVPVFRSLIGTPALSEDSITQEINTDHYNHVFGIEKQNSE